MPDNRGDQLKELTKLESKCEKLLEKSGAFDLEACYVLREIRNSGAYRARHNSWEMYCQVRWGMGVNPARARISAADVMDALAEFGPHSHLPNSPTIASQLIRGIRPQSGRRWGRDPLSAEQRAEIGETWREVLADGRNITTNLILEIVSRRRVVGAAGKALAGARDFSCRMYVGPSHPASVVASRLVSVLPLGTIDALIGELLTYSRNQRAMAAD
jgi:hypothetical protein